jgi:8-oxo-dGTP pyrophosphatase MutT (NUDIX family)
MSPDVLAFPAFTELFLRERLRRFLGGRPPAKLAIGSTTAAAVLLPLFERDGETCIWLVRRPTSMRRHAGQVAFPGGKSDACDQSLLVTALRETEEELGIARADVDVLGALDDLRTVTGFTITPWIGWLSSGARVRPNAGEVARAFAPPIRVFMDAPTGAPPRGGWAVDGEFVWGATAALMSRFVAAVRASAGSPG